MLEAAAAAKSAASPPDHAWDGLALVRKALLIALAQKEAKAGAGPTHPRRGRDMLVSAGRNATAPSLSGGSA
jgi:hypothetical protein